MNSATDLLHAILAAPDDDTPRLIYADEIESDDPARAEFIRTQIKRGIGPFLFPKGSAATFSYVEDVGCHVMAGNAGELVIAEAIPGIQIGIRRGFPESVSCTLADWVGGVCENCEGGRAWVHNYPCPHCHGTGRLPGIAAKVCGAWPVRVCEFADKKPTYIAIPSPRHGLRYYWYDERTPPVIAPQAIIPNVLFDIMHKSARESHYRISGGAGNAGRSVYFWSEKDALTALSDAAIRYGRRLAELES